jgi:two-component system sensor histidine kinase KdpD
MTTPETGAGEGSGKRGELRILLGAAPGVGKTYAMLNEGRRLRDEGRDVVIGYVETHGRQETAAQIANLEVILSLDVKRGNLIVSEMDTDAILARRPEIVLIDELAHSNSAGMPRAKRYQDVELIRANGIDVITTLNIQHVRELQDIVASVTGVTVQELIPDHILDSATDIQLVDLPIEVLLRRLEQGKIYPPDRAQRAMTGFFREGNLTALRELALRRTAADVDDQLSNMMLGESSGNHPAERLLVLVHADDRWSGVLRHAWRLASVTHAELVAITLVPGGDIAGLPEEQRNVLERQHQLAEDLGARVMIVSDESGSVADRAKAVVSVLQAERITIFVVGIVAVRRHFRTVWDTFDLVSAVMRQVDGVDIHLVKMSGVEELELPNRSANA